MTVTTFSRSLVISVGILLLSSISSPAQQTISAKIDKFINTEMRLQRIPGLSLAVLKNGHILLIKGYGFANIEHQVPVKPETVFQSGSIGKQFTATAVMMLVEEGKLSLGDKITRYFPDAPESWKDVTVHHLLTHTSGLGDYAPDFDVRRDYTEDELLAHIKKVPLNYRTGEDWDYSNLNYVLLGILIHKVTGKFYGDYLAERVFRPLGMTASRVISESDIVRNRASGYRLVTNELKNQEWVSATVNTTADGSLYLTAQDMTKWDAALYSDKLLKQSTLAQMWAPVKLSNGPTKGYGFGWHTEMAHGHRIIFHGGAWQGFKSFIVRFPEEKLTIVFFANLWQTNEFRVARGLTSIFYPAFRLPAMKPIEDKELQVTGLVRNVLRQLAQGTADPKLFTPEMQADFFPQMARQITASLNILSLPVAIISSLELIERKNENELRVFRYVLTDVGRTLFCTIRLTTDNKIAGLQVSTE